MKNSIFAHDRLIHEGWWEAVLKDLLKKYGRPWTVIFTLFSIEYSLNWYPVITVFPKRINKLFVKSKQSRWKIIQFLFDYRNSMLFYPLLIRILRRKMRTHIKQQPASCDLIVSSFACMKNILNSSLSHHLEESILYLHSPMQYIWANYEEYSKKLTWIKKILFMLCSPLLRKRDLIERSYTSIYANSFYTAWYAQKLYSYKNIIVQYPSLDQRFIDTPPLKKPFSYYLFVWRVVKYVRELDRIIDVCNDLAVPLLIMWWWPDKDELMLRAWPTITFLWHITNVEEKITIIKQAKWLINLAKESCGIATMEALALWVPVLWYNAWWTKELITDSHLWILLDNKDHHTIMDGWKQLEKTQYNKAHIKETFLDYYQSVGSIM